MGPKTGLSSQELVAGATVFGNDVLRIRVSADGRLRIKPGFISDPGFAEVKRNAHLCQANT
ncbi:MULTISPECIES: hypothetical protein [unclassified Leucobacter]|uniref:hypothetical protein n=1 Tax=unclassified Leucobacter TaxID=2621730 RepID=UPI00165EB97F|nr:MULTISPECIES: hypothetical protein [unclassified Leucobacter]MBC9927965.1 hypothetical protein [Leucobacter sp. cx-169]